MDRRPEECPGPRDILDAIRRDKGRVAGRGSEGVSKRANAAHAQGHEDAQMRAYVARIRV